MTFTADEDATPGTLYRIWYGERWGFSPDGQYIYFRIGENQGTDPDQPEYVTAKFYVIRPGKDTSSTDDENWMYVGEGTIDISGLDLQPGQEPVDVSLDVDGRVQGYPNDDVIKQRIAFLYGLELSSTTITYTPYKISYPNGWVDEYGASQESATPTYHVDMAVSYSTTTKVNANFYLWDVASDGYDYLADEYQSITLVDGKGSVQSPEGNYPPTKTENDVEYVFSGWYDNSELTGTPVKFPDEVSSAKQYYAKYVPQDAYSVRYYDSHNNTNATVLPKSFNKDYPEDKVAYAATREEVVDAGGEVSQGQQQRLVGWSTEPVQGVLNGADKFEELVSAGKFVAFGQQLPQSDTDLYAIWMKESEAEKVFFDITYKANAGDDAVEGMPADEIDVAAGTKQTRSTKSPTREGYEFVGWELTSPSDLEIADDGTFTMPNDDVVFTAQWKKTMNVGTSITVEVVMDGQQVTASDYVTPEKWADNTSDIAFTQDGNIYSVTFKYDDLNCADFYLQTRDIPAGYKVESVTSDNPGPTTGGGSSAELEINDEGEGKWSLNNVPGGATVTVKIVKIDLPISYEFVAKDGSNLPSGVTDQLGTPESSTTKIDETVKNEFADAQYTAVEVTDPDTGVLQGTWTFDSWDNNEKVADSSGVTFTGTWAYAEATADYTADYQFVAADGSELPSGVTDQLVEPDPADTYKKYETADNKLKGAQYTAVEVTDPDTGVLQGTWTFDSWDKDSVEDVSDDVMFTGTWAWSPAVNSMLIDNPQDVPYNGTNQTWTPTVTDGEKVLVAGRDYEVSYSTDDRTNVTGTITVTITGKVDAGYTGSVTRTYQILPLTITVTPRDIRKTQGQADPTLTSDYSGYLSGETAGWTGALTREPGEAVGTYTISRGSLQLADNPGGNFLAQNYILVVNEGTFTIVAAPVTPGGGGDTPTPTPGGGGDGTPTPGTPATVTPADDTTTDEAAPEETIADDDTALAAPTDTIGDDDTPLAAGAKDEDCWVHWLILLGMILSAVYFVGVGVRRRKFTSSLLGYEDKVLGNDRDNA